MTQNDIKVFPSPKRQPLQPSESRLTKTVANNLARMASERGLSVAELAGVLGLSPVFVGEFLAGRRSMSVLTVMDICDKLQVDLGQLMLKPPVSQRN